MDDLDRTAFGGLSVGISYRLLDHAAHGVGFAVSGAPYWTRIDDDSGESVNGYGSDFVLAADVDLVPKVLVGVLNLVYEPEQTKSRVDGSWSRENTAGLGGGLMFKLKGNIAVGPEARNLRKYDSLDFGAFAGQAFYLGQTLSVSFSDDAWLTVGWSAQIAGRPVPTPSCSLSIAPENTFTSRTRTTTW
jgi:hypothetical protein